MRPLILVAVLALTACPGNSEGTDSCPAAFSGCQSLTDATGPDAGRTIRFGAALGNTYDPQCLEVKVGQTVRFEGDFAVHPLAAACGTLEATLASNVVTGTSTSLTFGTAGDFGYFCSHHGTAAGTGMAGFIRVRP